MRAIRSLFLLCAFVTAMCAQVPVAGGPYSVLGKIVFGDGSPVDGAEISLTAEDQFDALGLTLTDTSGHFEFQGVPQGSYFIEAWRSDLGFHRWGQRADAGAAEVLNVNAKYPASDITFSIPRSSAITGEVRDLHGQVSNGAAVQAYREALSDGNPAFLPAAAGQTDGQGRFRLPHLLRGRYRVCAQNTAEAEDPPVGLAIWGAAPNPGVYGETCYPETGGFLLTEGSDKEIELRLATVSPSEVIVRLKGAPPGENLAVQLLSATQRGGVMRSPLTAGSEYRFQVPPGKYWLTAEGNKVAGRMLLDASGGGQYSVEFPVAPRPRVRVNLHAPGNVPIAVSAIDATRRSEYHVQSERTSEGLFLTLPYPGRYYIVTRTNYCPVAASYGEQPALRSAIDVAPGSDQSLDITFSDKCASFEGHITDSNGKAVPRAQSMILLTGTPDDPGDACMEEADDEGRIFYEGITPGSYSLWAWKEDEEWDGDLRTLKELAPLATRVEFHEGSQVQATIPVLDLIRARQ